MPIPELTTEGFLPPGQHVASLNEVQVTFGQGVKRGQLMKGLRQVASDLRIAGADRVWIDGSFVTAKQRPADVDVVYGMPAGADIRAGYLATMTREGIKRLHGVDLWRFPSRQWMQPGMPDILQFFCLTRDDKEKGIVLLKEATDD